MNYVRHLNKFFMLVYKDERLTTSHLGLYFAIFHYWNLNHFQNPFSFPRKNIMQLAKIGSKNTYHKCLKDLHHSGYIKQINGSGMYQKPQISIVRLDNFSEEKNTQQLSIFFEENCPNIGTDQLPDSEKNCPKNETHTVPILTEYCPNNDTVPVPILGHYIKQTFKTNKREEKSAQNFIEKNLIIQEKKTPIPEEENMPRTVPKMGQTTNNSPPVQNAKTKPLLSEVEELFQQNGYQTDEAKKFFYHYESNGWLIAGKTPMKDWTSSAHKWILNKPAFKTAKKSPHDLNTNTDKNYAEPL